MREHVSYENIARLLRDLRTTARKTQAGLAEELAAFGIAVDRFKITRIERGHLEMGKELAVALDSFAQAESLLNPDVPIYGFAALVGERDAFVVGRQGGIELTKLLSAPDVTEVYAVLCDESDLAFHVRSGLRTAIGRPALQAAAPRKIFLVVPSRERVDELFGSGAATASPGRGEFFAGYAERLWRHILVQVHRFERLAGQSEGVDVEVFTSKAVLNPVVVAKSRERLSCLAWPCAPSREQQVQPETDPIVARQDLATWYEHQVRSMIAGQPSVTRRQDFCDTFLMPSDVAARERSGESGVRSIGDVGFSRFLPREKLAKYEDKYSLEQGEALAVAMILPYVRTMRAAEPRCEVLLKRRSALLSGAESEVDDQLAFLAARVTASCMWDAAELGDRAGEDPDGHSSHRPQSSGIEVAMHHEDQSAEMVERLRQVSESETVDSTTDFPSRVMESAYKLAAIAELRMTYGVTFGGSQLAERLTLIKFEDSGDIAIPKPNAPAIIPRLFRLRLEPDERDELIALAARNDGNKIESFETVELLSLIKAAGDNSFERAAEQAGLGKLDDTVGTAMSNPRLSAVLSSALDEMQDDVQRSRAVPANP